MHGKPKNSPDKPGLIIVCLVCVSPFLSFPSQPSLGYLRHTSCRLPLRSPASSFCHYPVHETNFVPGRRRRSVRRQCNRLSCLLSRYGSWPERRRCCYRCRYPFVCHCTNPRVLFSVGSASLASSEYFRSDRQRAEPRWRCRLYLCRFRLGRLG